MTGDVAKPVAAPVALRQLHDIATSRQELMALRFDLAGALDAGQLGLARYTANNLLDAAVVLWLLEHDVAVPSFANPAARWRTGLELLAKLNPGLADQAWDLCCAGVALTAATIEEHCGQVLQLVATLASYESASDLRAPVTGWAERSWAVWQMCEALGLPVKNWYWAPPESPDWYADVMRYVSEQVGDEHS